MRFGSRRLSVESLAPATAVPNMRDALAALANLKPKSTEWYSAVDRICGDFEHLTAKTIFAAGATFTLLAWAFAYAYVACEAILPGSFSAPGSPDGPRTWMELLFVSVAVLSSVGLSDILPATGMARSLVMLE